MKIQRNIPCLLLFALLFAACSEDEAILSSPTGGVEGAGTFYTFTASLDASMQGDKPDTRATATTEDAPTRCFMQAVRADNASETELVEGTVNGTDKTLTFTIKLHPDKNYTYLFWADNGTAAVTTLTAAPYAIGNVAYAQRVTTACKPGELTAIPTLKHVVTKVTLKSTTAVNLNLSQNVTLATNCATTYNVAEAKAGSSSQTYTYTESSKTSIAADGEALSCYVLPAEATQTVTIGVNLLTQNITYVPLAANTHVTLQGDLSEASKSWGSPSDAYKEAKFRSYFFDESGNPKGEQQVGYDNCYCFGKASQEAVLALMKEITRNDSFTLPTGSFFITYDLILNRSVGAYIYYIWYIDDNDKEYEFFISSNNYYSVDFSTIYPGTN